MMKIRKAKKEDIDKIQKILISGCMLNFPEQDGKKAMLKILKLQPDYFLVAEENKEVLGMIRGCYDGSRALIHQLIIGSDARGKGVGTHLLKAITQSFKKRGAKTISCASTQNTIDFYKKFGFNETGVVMMTNFDINSVLK
ncbi:MAG: GNAT family N-acetyltransferase [Candidatus Woesearchaeota archaeon]